MQINTEYFIEYSVTACYSLYMSPQTPPDIDDLRLRILDAAEQRFRGYGYTKTTMAEVADDVDMSAANLYRYFNNKQDMAAACAQRCMSSRTDILRQLVRKKGLSASDKLRQFLMEDFRYTQNEAANQPKIVELISAVCHERTEIVHDKITEQCSLIGEILAQGNASGEFDIDDVAKTARVVYSSFTLFEVPIFLPLYSVEEFETMANGLVDLLLIGLTKR